MITELIGGPALYFRELGRYFRVIAIATSADEANGYIAARVPRCGVIAAHGELVFMALIDDGGIK